MKSVVLFTATCIEGDVRLGIGNFTEFFSTINEFEDYFFIKDELARGRVEVCVGGEFGSVCDDNWSSEDASMICSNLGFSAYGSYIHRNIHDPLHFLYDCLQVLSRCLVVCLGMT